MQIKKSAMATLARRSNWHKKAEPMAKGMFARVYRKKGMYPQGLLLKRGEIVKVYHPLAQHHPVAQQFWALKIAHELFPTQVPKTKAYSRTPFSQEIHMEEVPVHKELAEYQKMASKNPNDNWALENTPEYEACFQRFTAHHKTIKESEKKFALVGLKAGIENSLNVSLTNPNNPVFFEVEIANPIVLIQHINTLPARKKNLVLDYLFRWFKASEVK
jgi:hypothetical protein